MTVRHSHRWRRFLLAWVDFACRHARWVVVPFVLAAGAAGWFTLTHLKVDTDREKMLAADLPFRVTEERKRKLFPQFIDNLVLVVDAQTPEDARDAARTLAARLTERQDIFRAVYEPRSEFLERHGLLYLDTGELEDLAQRLAEVQPFLGRLTGDESLRGLFRLLREAVEAEGGDTTVDLTPVVERVTEAVDAALEGAPYRLSWQALMRDEAATPERTRQFVLAQPRLDYGRLFPARPALAAVRAVAADLGRDPEAGVRVRVTGGLAMAHEELVTVRQGIEWVGLGALVLVGFILWFGLGSRRMVFASLTTLVIGLALTAGFAMLAIGHLNLISIAFGILYIGLGIDYSIHYCLRFREGVKSGIPTPQALREAAQDVGGSLVLCSVSTALGFFAFVPTAYAGVSELGLISGTGMFISLLLNLTFLPALLTTLSRPRRGPRRFTPQKAWVRRVVQLPVRFRRGILLGSAVLGLAALVSLPALSFDVNPLNLRDPESESVATFEDLLRTSETPPWNLDVLVHDEQGLATYGEALRARPEIDKVVSVNSFVPADQEAKLAILEDTALALGLGLLEPRDEPPPTPAEQLEAARVLADALEQPAYLARTGTGTDKEAARALAAALRRLTQTADGDAQLLLARLGRSLLDTLPGNIRRLAEALEAEGFDRSQLPADLLRRWVGPDGTLRVSVFAREDLTETPALRRFVAAVRHVAPAATGSPVIMIEAGEAIVGAFRQALIVALLATTLALVLLLRNLADVLFVLMPLLLAAALTCGTMVLLGVPFNFANVIALPLLLGVGMDNGIHMVDRARHGLRNVPDRNPLRTSTARAVVFSTLTTTLSFGQLALSPHPGTATMGHLLTLGMLFTLLTTLIVLPALLSWHRDRLRRTETS